MPEWYHIEPNNDLKPHDTSSATGKQCHCNPRIDWDNCLVIHNAFDCREAVEMAEDILDDNPQGD